MNNKPKMKKKATLVLKKKSMTGLERDSPLA
jgi:hypothetical protein